MGKTEITYDEVRQLLSYDPATGWMKRRVTTSSRAMCGQVVGCENTAGYLVVRIGPKLYYVHRLAWLWMTGEWPKNSIDHIDRDKRNNRWDNLRDVTYSVNHLNKEVASGVYWAHRDAVWIASIQVNGIKKHIGQHKDRVIAERMYADYKQQYLPNVHQTIR